MSVMVAEEGEREEGEGDEMNQPTGIDPNDRIYELLAKIELRLTEIAGVLRFIASQKTAETPNPPPRPPKRV